MTLSLTASPTLVAREARPGVWDWVLEPADVAALRMGQAAGTVGTALRRIDGGQFALVAWGVQAQRKAAEPLQAARQARKARQVLLAPEGYTPRAYRQPGRPVGMRTYVPYAHEPAHW